MTGAAAALRDVGEGIRAEPGRTALAAASIAVGAAALTVLLAILGGLEERSRRLVDELGVNVLGVLRRPAAAEEQRTEGLEERHAALLATNLPECLVATVRRYEVPTPGTAEHLTVVATDERIFRVRRWKLADGRLLDERDLEGRERNAVVGRALSETWKWRIGTRIFLRDVPFTIVGIADIGGGAVESEAGAAALNLGERVVFVPRTVAPTWAAVERRPRPAVDAIFLLVPGAEDFERTVARAQRLLAEPDQRAGAVDWVTPALLTRGVRRMQATIGLAVGAIAALCLLLGGTTLMSLMVANVRDRVTEIGVRRALGASRRQIASLFVLEAGLVSGAAAAVATAATHAAIILAGHALPASLRLDATTALAPVGAAVALGLAFSWWPARAAARIVPAEALRAD